MGFKFRSKSAHDLFNFFAFDPARDQVPSKFHRDWDDDDLYGLPKSASDHKESDAQIELSVIGTFDSGLGEDSAEIVAHDPETQRLFITNGETSTVDVLDISDPSNPKQAFPIDVSTINGVATGGPNSVAVKNGIVAVAIEAETVTDPGLVAFFDADGNLLNTVTVGALPDALTFTPDGSKVLVANEGEADGGIDPKGSVSIIDLSNGVENATVQTADFTAFDAVQSALEDAGVRIFPGQTLSDDVEPEFIAVSEDGKTAFVTLQEANSVAVVDIESATVTEIQPLGAKDHSVEGNGIDPSDRDSGIDIQTVPVSGLYMPDAIASYDAKGQTFYVTANEGDARNEDARIKDVTLDPTAFPDAAELQKDENLGRLEVSTIDGDTDGDGDIDQLFSYGGRSFSIWDEAGNLVFDSGDMIAQITAAQTPEFFNANDGDPAEVDNRSDNKGAEPESVVIGEVNGNTYAFVGLERAGGGVMVFDISNPHKVQFVQYIRTDGDIAPEGLAFISRADSPTDVPLLAVTNEVSGTTTLYRIDFPGETIDGTGRSEKLVGTAGDDTIDAKGGNDTIYALAGDDDVDGGSGRDRIFGGDGNDDIDGGSGRDRIDAGDGDDTVDGGSGSDDIEGGEGDDTLLGGSGNDEIEGGDGDDDIDGGSGRDEIDGGDGDDTIMGGSGSDEIEGGDGDDTIMGGSGNDEIDGGDGDDMIDGGSGRDEIDGDDGNDIIMAGSGNDEVDGGDGDDIISGGTGRNELDGGDGIDTADYSKSKAGVIADLEEGEARTVSGTSWRDRIRDELDDFENLTGSNLDDTLIGTWDDNVLKGNDGDDDLFGGDGDDDLIGGGGNDRLNGGDGEDTAVFSGNRADYEIDFEAGKITDLREGSPDGMDMYEEVEFLEFADRTISATEPDDTTFTLQILHASDLEGGLDALERAPNFAALVEAFEQEFENTVVISAGDNYIPSPFFNASGDAATFNPLFEGLYNAFFGLIDTSVVDPAADTNDDGFFSNGELDAFIQATDGVSASDVYVMDINGDGFPDYFDEIDNHEGRADITIMNVIGFDASAVGNHEFDNGSDIFENIINYDSEEGNSLSGVGVSSITDEFGADALNFLQEVDWPGAQFPYLSANLDFSGDGDLGSLFTNEILSSTDFLSDLLSAREPLPGSEGDFPQIFETAGDVPDSNDSKIAPATIIEQGGEFIGVVGATTQLLESLSSPTGTSVIGGPFTDNDMAQLASVLQPIIDDLIAGDPANGREPVNKIILTSHLQQIALEQELANLLSGVDVILAGGSDTLLADETDVLRPGDVAAGPYPVETTDADGNPVVIMSTDGEYSYVGRLVIEFDANGNVITDSIDAEVSGAYATTDETVLDVTGETDIETAIANSEKATDVAHIVDAVQDVVIATDSNVFGETDVFLDGVRGSVRTEETNMGNLTADANLAVARSVDDTVLVSLKNGGGIRAPIGEVDSNGNELPTAANPLSGKEAGEISQLDIENTLRFDNGLTLITLTPEQLLQVLNHAVAATGPGATPGQFAQVGGVNFSFDPSLPAGDRVQSVALVDELGNKTAIVENGAVVDGAPSGIRIVTLDFLASGGDGYPYPDFVAADPTFANRVDLDTIDPTTIDGELDGNADFSGFGGEQDALAEFLAANHPVVDGPDGPNDFDQAETPPELDERIQNLSARDDTVLEGASSGPQIAINEIRIDQPGTDTDEFFELFGEAGVSLDGLSYIVVGDGPGGSGVIESVTDLSGLTLDGDGLFLAAEGCFTLGTADLTTTLGFENSDNVTHLLVRDFTGANGDDLDTDDDGILDTTPWTEIVDSVALVEDLNNGEQVYSDTQVGPDGTFVPGHVFRSPDGGDFLIGAFDPVGGLDTPGSANPVPVAAAIFEIQGAGHVSTLQGQLVITSGIVTAVAFNGFYMQDPTGDGDDATSDGIFVETGGAPGVVVGDGVEVTGFVEEDINGSDLSFTQIGGNPAISVLSSGNALPAATVIGAAGRSPSNTTVISDDELPVNLQDAAEDAANTFDPENDAIDFFESLEGMRVTIDDPVAVSPTRVFSPFSAEFVTVADDGAGTSDGFNARGGINLDSGPDNTGDQNPERVQVQFDPTIFGSGPVEITVGDNLSDITGVMGYSFGNFEVNVTDPFSIETPSTLTQEVTSLTDGDGQLTVATYNVLNLTSTLAVENGVADPDAAQREKLADQIVTNLGSPNIIALQEIQDNSGRTDDGVTSADQTLQDLVDAIALAGGPTYAFADVAPVDGAQGGVPGGNIRNAFLYDPNEVTLESVMALTPPVLDLFGVSNPDAFAGTRTPLLGIFEDNDGNQVAIVNNHLTSRFGSTPVFGATQPFVQAGEAEREAQVEALNEFVDGFLLFSSVFGQEANVMVVGDMNTFEFTNDLSEILPGTGSEQVLTNLIDQALAEDDAYTFVFEGNSQVLDHVFVSDGLLALSPEFDIVHVNNDFTRDDDGDVFVDTLPASDHEPIVVRLDFSDPAAVA